MVELKFCGLTRPEDAAHAAALGARYVGVVFAESLRQVTDADAMRVLGQIPLTISRVGVFGDTKPEQIAERAQRLELDVIQLHGDPKPRVITRVRRTWRGQVWAVQRLTDATIPPAAADLFDAADGVLLDAKVSGQLGGTGVALPWDDLAEKIAPYRSHRAKLIVAGGLTPENVGRAIAALKPDVVDVSSGVEADIGIKDHQKMSAFRDAVNAAVAGSR